MQQYMLSNDKQRTLPHNTALCLLVLPAEKSGLENLLIMAQTLLKKKKKKGKARVLRVFALMGRDIS